MKLSRWGGKCHFLTTKVRKSGCLLGVFLALGGLMEGNDHLPGVASTTEDTVSLSFKKDIFPTPNEMPTSLELSIHPFSRPSSSCTQGCRSAGTFSSCCRVMAGWPRGQLASLRQWLRSQYNFSINKSYISKSFNKVQLRNVGVSIQPCKTHQL